MVNTLELKENYAVFRDGIRRRELLLSSFKTEPESAFVGKGVARVFLSSGTTQESRSRSLFSTQGLEHYRAASLAMFRRVLAEATGFVPEEIPGFSLVPAPLGAWQDSSLAQMVAWFREEFTLEYGNPKGFVSILPTDRPVWIFGTALHLLDVCENSSHTVLHPASVIFETGGFKGQRRETTRSKLYEHIKSTFGICTNNIISEYGMCELSAQAYDWVSAQQRAEVPLCQRWFRFDSCVRAYSIPHDNKSKILVVDDPNRVDYPLPIVTEDLVTWGQQSQFQLVGRAPKTPARGCSLNMQDLSTSIQSVETFPSAANKILQGADLCSDAGLAFRARVISLEFSRLLGNRDYQTALSAELQSPVLAKWATDSLDASVPRSATDWEKAALTACQGHLRTSWLFLLPGSHSIAGLYPLVMAYIAGFRCQLKLPSDCKHLSSSYHAILMWFDSLPDSHIALLPNDDRPNLTTNAYDGVFCFGADETLAFLRRNFTGTIAGGGTFHSLCIVDEENLLTHANAIARDVLALNRRGCMSTQGVILVSRNAPHTQTAIQRLQESLTSYEEVLGKPNILVDARHLRSLLELKEASKSLDAQGNLAVFVIQEDIANDLLGNQRQFREVFPSVKLITTTQDPNLHGIVVRNVGQGQVAPWDGFHENRPLYAPV